MNLAASYRKAWPLKRNYHHARVYLWVYAALVSIPLIFSLGLPLYYRTAFPSLVTIFNILGLSALLWQFLLSARARLVAQSWGLDPALSMHRRVGEWIAIFFFLHPFLILLPRTWIAGNLALDDLWLSITQKSMHTGLFAWSILIIWTLVSISKTKARLSYEAWRYSHAIGFLAVAILAVLHAMDVGRHGQSQPYFNIFWIAGVVLAGAVTLYGLAGRPAHRQRHKFRVESVTKAGSSDWVVRLRHSGDTPFDFEAGQFIWLSADARNWMRAEHPFSIASSPDQLPMLELVIRDLGDFTSQLHLLSAGKEVFLDGPYGQFTLAGRAANGLVLVAGGAGIGPMLSLLRSLAHEKANLPIHLLYGNRRADQMIAVAECQKLQSILPDMHLHYALEEAHADWPQAYIGRIDANFLRQYAVAQPGWLAYVCGPPAMVQASVELLNSLGWPKDQIIYESFGF